MKTEYNRLRQKIKALARPASAKALEKFFKTAKGEYGEGDRFLGLTMPQLRSLAKTYNLGFPEIKTLLSSPWHEERMLGLIVLCEMSKKAERSQDHSVLRKLKIFYLKNKKGINNWDLVDASAMYVLGPYYFEHGSSELYKMAKSKNLWDRRIAMMTTFYFVRKNQFSEAMKIAKLLLNDDHDLIHKASGWMLREVGRRDKRPLIEFLEEHAAIMPRTMLRYALEKLTTVERKRFMEAKKKTTIFP